MVAPSRPAALTIVTVSGRHSLVNDRMGKPLASVAVGQYSYLFRHPDQNSRYSSLLPIAILPSPTSLFTQAKLGSSSNLSMRELGIRFTLLRTLEA